jgi:manganese-dependent inorganic pyrophosphatase
MEVLVFGHKNPDTDSVTSAIAFSYLKNKLGFNSIPCVLGPINKESKYVLDYFNIDEPVYIDNVKTQLEDLNLRKVQGLSPEASILSAYKIMQDNKLKTLPIINEDGKLLGITTMYDIAVSSIKGIFFHLNTTLSNVAKGLDGTIITGHERILNGQVLVAAFYYETLKGRLSSNKIVIVGDRYDIIEHSLESNVQLLIITGNQEIPKEYIEEAKKKNIPIISVPTDTYITSKIINQCNFVSSIMKRKDLVKFKLTDYTEEIKDEMVNTNFSNYPVVDKNHIFKGFISRKHLLSPAGKNVILVDHNEYGQSAEGLKEANILEIVDHHKLGDIATTTPINFRNIPVGSTCTVVYSLFKENNVEIPKYIAGVLLSGIISDTLFFKSPTTTFFDREAVDALNKILNLNLDEFSTNMFKAGTSLEGQTIEEIFFKDFKEFDIEGFKVGVGQVFTLAVEDILNKKEEFLNFINSIHHGKDYHLTLLLATDIINEGSYLLFESNNKQIIPISFNVDNMQGVFSSGIVSRKKQVIPRITEAINTLK